MVLLELAKMTNAAPIRVLTLVVLMGLAGSGAALSGEYEPGDITGDFKTAIVMDADTGMILLAHDEHTRRQPASMIKMMTELIVLEHVADGDIAMDDEVRVSAKASRMGGSQVYLAHNEVFTVEELLMALAIHSANDAAVALAEHVAGSTDAFVDLMNMRAKDIGMTDTHLATVHGLPPGRNQEPDLTTAYDLAMLARELIRHDRVLKWSATRTAPFRDGKFILTNPNKLVGTYRGLDGIKTGYTVPARFCVTASAVQKGKRLISVVMGCSTDYARANETTRLLTRGFNLYKQVEVIAADGVPLATSLRVKAGKQQEAPLVCAAALTVSVPLACAENLVVEYRLPENVEAPVAKGTPVGTAVVLLDGRELGSVPVVTAVAVARGNWLERLFH